MGYLPRRRGGGIRDYLASTRRLCFDTNAIIYFFNGVLPYLGLLEELMESARSGQRHLVFSTLTELELLVRPIRESDEDEQERVRMLFEETENVQVQDVSRPVARIAAQLRALDRLAIADATIVATGIYTGCDAIVGNDERCAQRVRDIPYVLLDDLVKEQSV